MKRGWKIFWIVLAAITGLGVLFGCVALAMGLTFSQIEAAYPNGIGFVEETRKHWEEDDWHSPAADAQEFQNISSLDLSVGGCGVCILPSEDDKVRIDRSKVKFGNSGLDISISEESGTLRIETTKDGSIWDVLSGNGVKGITSRYGTLYCYLPRNLTLESADLELGAAEVEIEGIRAKNLNIKLGAAECSVDALDAENLTATVGAGALEIEGVVRGNADVECGVGSVEMELEGRKEDFNYAVKCGIGEVEIDDTMKFSGLSNTREINNGSSRNMALTCGIGSIEVAFQ